MRSRKEHAAFNAKGIGVRIGDFKKELSNSRIVARSMEMMPVHWLIGRKIYEPPKILVFLEAMWMRVLRLEKSRILLEEGDQRELIGASDITSMLRRIKRDASEGKDTTPSAEKLFGRLITLAAAFLNIYFRTLTGRFNAGGAGCIINRRPT